MPTETPADILEYASTPAPVEAAGPHWLSSAIWAVMDQGLFAFSNLVLNVLLFLWLPEEVYGGFAVGFAIFLLMGTLHNAFFIDPMLVFGNDMFHSRLKTYLGTLLTFEAGFGVLTCLVLLGTGLGAYLLHSWELASALIAMAYAGPFILFLWLMRRTCYMRLEPHLAAIAGLGYFVLMIGGLYVINHYDYLSIWTATAVLTASSFIAAAWLVVREGVDFPRPTAPIVREAFKEHWEFGRWAAAGGLVGYVPAQAYYLILPIFASLEAAGLLRALANLVLPVVQANVAISTLFLSKMVRTRSNPEAFNRIVRLGLTLLGGGALLYWLILGLFHEPICHLVYRGKFDAQSSLLWVIGLQPAIAGVFGIFHAVLEAHRRPDRVFYASLIPAIATATIGVVMTWRFGIAGAIWSGVFSLTLNLALSFYFVKRVTNAPPAPQAGKHEGLAHVPVAAEDIER